MPRPPAYPAHLYIAQHRGTPGDISFYRRRCRGVQSILELGCGDGRVLASLDDGERRLAGLDIDEAMLAHARNRFGARSNVRFVLGNMTRFSLRSRFDRILIPFSGFFCLSPRGKGECLDCIRRHLAPGGALLLDVYATDALDPKTLESDAVEPLEDEFEWVSRTKVGSSWYQVYEKNSFWPSRQRLDVTYRYVREPESHSVPEDGLIRHWYLLRPQIESLLRRHRFEPIWLSIGARGEASSQWAVEARVAQ